MSPCKTGSGCREMFSFSHKTYKLSEKLWTGPDKVSQIRSVCASLLRVQGKRSCEYAKGRKTSGDTIKDLILPCSVLLHPCWDIRTNNDWCWSALPRSVQTCMQNYKNTELQMQNLCTSCWIWGWSLTNFAKRSREYAKGRNIRSHNHRIDPPVFGLIVSVLEDPYKYGLVLERPSHINANMCANYENTEFQMQNLCTSRWTCCRRVRNFVGDARATAADILPSEPQSCKTLSFFRVPNASVELL